LVAWLDLYMCRICMIPHTFNQNIYYLVVITYKPSEKYARQIGNLPLSRGKNRKYSKPPPSLCMYVNINIYIYIH